MNDLQVGSVETARPRTGAGTNSSRSADEHGLPSGGVVLRFGGAGMNAPDAQTIPLWHGLDEVPPGFGPCAVTLGVFDGMHRGHRQLVERAVRVGDSRGLPTVLVTFDPHPADVLGLPRDTARLSTLERRAELARELGLDAVCALPFTSEFSRLSPAEFGRHVLAAGLRAQAVVVGANFTFGRRAAGTVDTLRELGLQHGFTTHRVDLLHEAATRCSSSAVRARLRDGDIRGANRVLGRPHRIEGSLHPAGTGASELVTAAALPAPDRYRDVLIGTGPVALRVTGDGRALVESANPRSGEASVEVIDREEPR